MLQHRLGPPSLRSPIYSAYWSPIRSRGLNSNSPRSRSFNASVCFRRRCWLAGLNILDFFPTQTHPLFMCYILYQFIVFLSSAHTVTGRVHCTLFHWGRVYLPVPGGPVGDCGVWVYFFVISSWMLLLIVVCILGIELLARIIRALPLLVYLYIFMYIYCSFRQGLLNQDLLPY